MKNQVGYFDSMIWWNSIVLRVGTVETNRQFIEIMMNCKYHWIQSIDLCILYWSHACNRFYYDLMQQLEHNSNTKETDDFDLFYFFSIFFFLILFSLLLPCAIVLFCLPSCCCCCCVFFALHSCCFVFILLWMPFNK